MGAVDTTYTFTATDTITSTKMNNIIDQTTITSDAIIGTTLEVASGKLKVRSAGITSNELATNAVTSTTIAAGAVTPSKLSSGGPTWSGTGAGGVFGVPQTGLEFGTGHTQDFGCFIDLHAAAIPTDFETRVVRNGGANGNFEVINQGTGSINLSSAGGVKFGTATLPNPSGTAPIYGIRAWVNFDGITTTTKSGTYSRILGSTTATISIVGHGLLTGHHVYLDFATGSTDKVYSVTRVDDNVFTVVTTETTAQSGVVVDFQQNTITSFGNVSNVCKISNVSGQFIINFLTALPDANYTYNGSAIDNGATGSDIICGRVGGGIKTTQSILISTFTSGASGINVSEVCFSFIR